MSRKRGELGSRRDIPYLGQFIVTRSGNSPAIGREGDALCTARVACDLPDARAVGNVPKPERSILARRGQELTVARKIGVGHRGRMTFKCSSRRPVVGVPEIDRRPLAAGGQSCPIGGKHQRDSAQIVPRPDQAVQLFAGVGIQILTLPLWAVATLSPSGVRATVPTQPALLRNVTWVSGAAAGQSLTVPSRLPDAARVPSGPKATQWTKLVCP